MARPGGQLERALASLTIGMQQSIIDRKEALRDTKTGVWTQVVHLDLHGQAAPGLGSIDKKVQWQQPFVPGTLQCGLPFKTPDFKKSIEMTAGIGELIRIDAQVIGWTITESNWYVGATVRFLVDAPNVTALTPFSAVAHMTFRGYAAAAETDEFA